MGQVRPHTITRREGRRPRRESTSRVPRTSPPTIYSHPHSPSQGVEYPTEVLELRSVSLSLVLLLIRTRSRSCGCQVRGTHSAGFRAALTGQKTFSFRSYSSTPPPNKDSRDTEGRSGRCSSSLSKGPVTHTLSPPPVSGSHWSKGTSLTEGTEEGPMGRPENPPRPLLPLLTSDVHLRPCRVTCLRVSGPGPVVGPWSRCRALFLLSSAPSVRVTPLPLLPLRPPPHELTDPLPPCSRV